MPALRLQHGRICSTEVRAVHPQKVSGIITLATKFEWTPEIAAKETAMLNPAVIEEKVPGFAAALENLHAPLDWKTVMNKTAELLVRLGNGEGLKEEEFRKIDVPVVLCLGSGDQMVSLKETESASQLLPQAEVMIIEGAQHMLEKTDPALIAEVIGRFQ